MQTIKEFMRKYFAEQANIDCAAIAGSVLFRERFFTAELVTKIGESIEQDKVYEKINPSKVESIEVTDSTAKVVASETRGGSSQRRIYYLKASNSSWQIDRKGIECFHCDGSGIYDEKVCSRCNGEGWRLFGTSDR